MPTVERNWYAYLKNLRPERGESYPPLFISFALYVLGIACCHRVGVLFVQIVSWFWFVCFGAKNVADHWIKSV